MGFPTTDLLTKSLTAPERSLSTIQMDSVSLQHFYFCSCGVFIWPWDVGPQQWGSGHFRKTQYPHQIVE